MSFLAGGRVVTGLVRGAFAFGRMCRPGRRVSQRISAPGEGDQALRQAAAERPNNHAPRRHRALLQDVIDAIPANIFLKDREGTWLLVNGAMSSTYGLTIEEMTGTTQRELSRRRGVPTAEVERFLASDRQVIDSGQPVFVAEEPRTINGRLHWVQTTKVPPRACDKSSSIWSETRSSSPPPARSSSASRPTRRATTAWSSMWR